jgi:uncharacterized protein with PIN domain
MADASAIFAILNSEPEGPSLAAGIERHEGAIHLAARNS